MPEEKKTEGTGMQPPEDQPAGGKELTPKEQELWDDDARPMRKDAAAQYVRPDWVKAATEAREKADGEAKVADSLRRAGA